MQETKTLHLNLFGGPGVGKSATAYGLAYKLKLKGVKCDYVSEFAKTLAWLGDMKSLAHQSFVTSSQMQGIYVVHGQVDYIISDSPFILGIIYGGHGATESFSKWVLEVYASYNSLNILLERNPNLPYETEGRYQNAEEAALIDAKVKNLLQSNNLPFTSIKVDGENTVNEIINLLGV